jgi:hypothetical protein
MLLEDLDLGIMLRGLPLREISANKYYPTVENKRPNDDHEVLASNPFPAPGLGMSMAYKWERDTCFRFLRA